MKRPLAALIILVLLTACRLERAPAGHPGGGYAVEPDSAMNVEVNAALREYYAALSARSWKRLGRSFLPRATITDLRQAPGEPAARPHTVTIEEFVARAGRVRAASFLDEPLHATIVTYGPLADAWVTYRARIGVRRDSVVTRLGIDAFHLMKVGGRWRIVGLAFQNELPGQPIASEAAPSPPVPSPAPASRARAGRK